jgi:DNA-binding PadR family transcriptional regulator
MAPTPARGGEHARGALSLYALALMEREGSIHGYRLAERIQQRTDGAWRPGPGAIYPALERLVRRDLAKRARHGRRQDYTITKEGRELLARVRARTAPPRPGAPDLTALWAEVMGAGDPGAFLLVRLRTSIDGLTLHLNRPTTPSNGNDPLRGDAIAELERGLLQLRRARKPQTPRSSRGAG